MNKINFIMPILSLALLSNCASGVKEVSQRELGNQGVNFSADKSVHEDAISRAEYTFDVLLSKRQDIRERMIKNDFTVEIIARNQLMTDLPRYEYLLKERSFDNRDYSAMRGVGSEDACSAGEENLLCEKGQKYPSEDIFVHELSHSIMFNMPMPLMAEIEGAYKNAKNLKLYPKESYAMATSQEYWAEGVQAWFYATVRTDVNGGINTREKLLKHDPKLAAIMDKVFGRVMLKKRPNCPY